MNPRIIIWFMLIVSCLQLSGCPATVKVVLTNETDSEIFILYSTGYESKIEAGETRKEIYKFNCIRIKSSGQLYEYQSMVPPPDEYFDTGVFSSSIYAKFTKEKEFKIYSKSEGITKVIALNRGCKN